MPKSSEATNEAFSCVQPEAMFTIYMQLSLWLDRIYLRPQLFKAGNFFDVADSLITFLRSINYASAHIIPKVTELYVKLCCLSLDPSHLKKLRETASKAERDPFLHQEICGNWY